MNIIGEIEVLIKNLDDPNVKFTDIEKAELDNIQQIANEVSKAWSGSWLGYHANVYYESFVSPPANAQFSSVDGLNAFYTSDTRGKWCKYQPQEVIDYIESKSGNIDIDIQVQKSKSMEKIFDKTKLEALSIFSILDKMDMLDNYLEDLKSKIDKIKIFSQQDYLNYLRPSGKFFSRDQVAISSGLQTPPHLNVYTRVISINEPFKCSDELKELLSQIIGYLHKMTNIKTTKDFQKGSKIFIGHGNSMAWRDLKDFINDRLGLAYDEFNRVPIAGLTNITRLSQMLDNACFAFLIMTAEDTQADGNLQARQNVIHEVGLFQGRLGFEKAIVLLEEGCKEFSNIHGLGQIRFPKGNIGAKFEAIREVLERENLLTK